jgi:hypothetical protein
MVFGFILFEGGFLMKVFCIFVIGATLGLGGCRYMTYVGPDGRMFYYVNTGFDTKVGLVDVTTADGAKVHIENVDSSSKALEVADEALKIVNKAP